MDPKKTSMNDRKKFLELLERAYGVTSENGYHFNFKEKGLTQKKVSQDLYFDDAQFGKMLKPDFKGYYNNVIARLNLKIRLNENHQKFENEVKKEVELAVEKYKAKSKQYIRKTKLLSFTIGMITSGLFLGFIYNFFITNPTLSNNKSILKNVNPTTKKLTSNNNSTILDPSFEQNDNGRFGIHWKNKHLGSLFHITEFMVFDGKVAAKLPASGDRIGYQQINVLKNKDYLLTFYYLMRPAPAGSLTVSVLQGKVFDPIDIEKATIGSTKVQDQSDEEKYKKGSLKFNSGDNEIVSIYFKNENVQCRLDALSLEML